MILKLDRPLVCFDLESTGLDVNNDRVVEIGLVRLHPDGRVPDDNPFAGNAAYHPAIWASGVRNAQGLIWDDTTGALYETEHGPMGGDEVNRIDPQTNELAPTDPFSKDTDRDGIPDGAETDTGINNGVADRGTDPVKPDTDGDGFNDNVELDAGSNDVTLIARTNNVRDGGAATIDVTAELHRSIEELFS